MAIRSLAALCLAAVLAACATSSQTLTGAVRAPIAPAEVRVYTQAPEHFEEIAELSASRDSFSSAGGERAIARMIESMRWQAAKLGANGLLLEDFSDANGVSLGTGVGSQTYTHNASISVGVGGSLGIVKKLAKARAIFVLPRGG
ncbi:MAG TPA: hypothetical protein VHW71_08070 [Steroidobacteraceae bacterium]|nr:hypothetical protein [Steroidobacteraceae bacterium]